MTQTRKVTPELIERLRREQQNAWGNVTLEDIAVTMPLWREVIMHGQADELTPGVVYHPEYYGMAPFEHLLWHRGSHCLWDKRGTSDPRYHRARRRNQRAMVSQAGKHQSPAALGRDLRGGARSSIVALPLSRPRPTMSSRLTGASRPIRRLRKNDGQTRRVSRFPSESRDDEVCQNPSQSPRRTDPHQPGMENHGRQRHRQARRRIARLPNEQPCDVSCRKVEKELAASSFIGCSSFRADRTCRRHQSRSSPQRSMAARHTESKVALAGPGARPRRRHRCPI